MKSLSKPSKSASTNQDQSGSEEFLVDMEGEVGAAEEEMLESSVHVTGSPGQSTSADVHHVNLEEESDDTVCSPCPRVPDVSLTHYCITFNIMPILQYTL